MKKRLQNLFKKLVLRRLIIILLFFFFSDAILRRIVYAPTVQSKGNESMMEILPEFLKDYFTKLEEIDRLENQLADTNETADRRKIFFEIAELSSERKQKHIYREIIREDPYSFQVFKAWQGLLREMSVDELMTDFLDYALYCNVNSPNEKGQVWLAGWFVLDKSTDDEAKISYLKHMADYRVTAGGLSGAYKKLMSHSIEKGLKHYRAAAEALEVRCTELYKQELRKAQEQQ